MRNNIEAYGQEKEREFTPSDCIVVLGHSIEEVQFEDESKWKPTRLIQKRKEIEISGETRLVRTGERDSSLSADDDMAYIGGGNAVSIAAAELYNQYLKQEHLPKAVIFAAGRPMYLKDKGTPDHLSEGVPMKEVFERKANVSKDQEIRILGENKQTKDDIEAPLKIALEKGYKSIDFLMLEMRIERARAFYENICSEHSEYSPIEVRFIPVEDVLKKRYEKYPERLKTLERIMHELENSRAFEKTKIDEVGGTEALRKKEYKGKGNY